MNLTIKDCIKPRSSLSEGRSRGVGHAFLRKTGPYSYEGIMPITACKDFLNDVVYTESTGKDWQAHGLFTKKTGVFEKQEFAYLETKVLKRYQGSPNDKRFNDECKAIKENAVNIEVLIVMMERGLKLSGPHSYIQMVDPKEDNHYVLALNINWVKSTFMISLVTLVARCGIWWDGKGGWRKFLDSYDHESGDEMSLKNAMRKYDWMVKNGVPVQNMDRISPHDLGIVSYQLPTK